MAVVAVVCKRLGGDLMYIVNFNFQLPEGWKDTKMASDIRNLTCTFDGFVELGECIIKDISLDKIDNWCEKIIKNSFKNPKDYLEMFKNWEWKEDEESAEDLDIVKYFSKMDEVDDRVFPISFDLMFTEIDYID